MDIQIQSSPYVRMSEQGADSLVVALALNASGGEAVPECMEFHMRDAEPLQEPVVIIPVCPRFRRMF